jgi:hypothetical protein
MATIGIDCELILDGTGYFVKPDTYHMKQPRIRKATVRADGGLSYVDLGPGKRAWTMVILCANDLLRYDGTPTGLTGQQYRDALRTSYHNVTGTSIQFSDPISIASIAVHFDTYNELVLDLHSQQVPLAIGNPPGTTYEVSIELLEV